MKTDLFLQAMNDLPDELILEGREVGHVRPRRKLLRTALLAAVLALLLSVTAYAAGGSLAGVHTHEKLEYRWSRLTGLPKAERLLGRDVIVPERFENGFAFKKLEILYSQLTDDAGEVVETWPELNVHYEDGGHVLYLGIETDRGTPVSDEWNARMFEGTLIRSHSVLYKVVPEDYTETEEDRVQQERGELMISWGSDRVEYYPTSSAQFAVDGMLYTLLNMDGVSAGELVEIAEEILSQRR